jgi:hypothetical protein
LPFRDPGSTPARQGQQIGDVTRAVGCRQGNRNALVADRRISVSRGSKGFLQELVGLRLSGTEPAARK